jgi:membrane-bound metal-dependent hydrolase YbcI (DUF457 family)
MPVLGHAFVGLATAIYTSPARPGTFSPRSMGLDLWTLALLCLAYLPDILSQILSLAGWPEARFMTHSVLSAVVASLLLAWPLSRLSRFSFAKAFALSLATLLFHDLLDLLQSTDRTPWWPISDHRISSGVTVLPVGLFWETILFGSAFALFYLLRLLSKSKPSFSVLGCREETRFTWLVRGLIGLIIVGAIFTHILRDKREHQLREGHKLLTRGDYHGVLKAAQRAEMWPSTARPGRTDYLKAIAYDRLGHRQEAEAHYLRSYSADPDYFWCVGDLALFYAKSGRPLPERRRLTEPYLQRLKNHFPNHRDLPEYLSAIQEALGR